MEKKEQFKMFVKNNPELIKIIQDGKMTWQNLFEIYDLYGEDKEKWKSYLGAETSVRNPNISLGAIGELVKKVDLNSIQKHINTAQKAINLFQDMAVGKSAKGAVSKVKGPLSARPINKFFED